MTKIVISSLGNMTMQPAEYAFSATETYTTPYFVHALTKHVGATHVIMLLTPGAHQKHWKEMQPYFDDLPDVTLEFVPIEMGTNDTEMWQNFATIANHLYFDDEIYFDVTNGLRSLPLIFLSAMRYFQRSLGVAIRGIYYGAYEAVTDQRKPVFRLDLFATLSDWATAVDVFLTTGEVNRLAALLNAYTFESPELHRSFNQLQSQLATFSQATQYNRPLDAMAAADGMTQSVRSFQAALATTNAAQSLFPQPFVDLLTTVVNACEPFAMPRATMTITHYPELLRRQLSLIQWCAEHEKPLAAIVIANEWVLTWAMFNEGKSLTDMTKYPSRSKFRQDALNTNGQTKQLTLSRLQGRIKPQKVVQLAGDIASLRNDLAHAGTIESPLPIPQISTSLRAILQELDALGEVLRID